MGGGREWESQEYFWERYKLLIKFQKSFKDYLII